jgi:hypothetical protein
LINLKGNTGAVRPIIIINIALVLFIAVTVVILLARSKHPPPAELVAPPQTKAPAIIFNVSDTLPEQEGQTGIDITALKQQLENERSRLKTLRVQEELVESIRRESELREITRLQDQTEAQTPSLDAPQADNAGNKDIPKQSAQ